MSGTLGFAMMAHENLDRASQVARHLATHGCPVVLHVDRKVGAPALTRLKVSLSDLPNVAYSTRFRCEWGTWSLVQAAQAAASVLLRKFPDVRHVYLTSGACLPLRPIEDLVAYLDARPRTDFIESVTAGDFDWAVGGLDAERFTLRFPFSWRRQRRLFDRYVAVQRRLGLSRRIPEGVAPHLGSQWWCLTRQTLSAILTDPKRAERDRYFSNVWIPDESYFQTLARNYATNIESRSLTLSKFDFQGKPHVFYDDHLALLRRSDCFMARKIWHRADALFDAFLRPSGPARRTEPNPGKIDRLFAQATERRTRGRPGLWMQSRFPRDGWDNGKTCEPFSVFEGFDNLFEGFGAWLARTTDANVHGHLFAEEGAEFAGGGPTHAGGLPAAAPIRDRTCHIWFRHLIWNTRGAHQALMFGPHDRQDIAWHVAVDDNARINVVSGAWAIPLFRSNMDFDAIRAEAVRLQRIETAHLEILRSPYAKARVRVWPLADFVREPMAHLQSIVDEMGPHRLRRLTEVPRMVDLDGFHRFLQNLRNQGMNPRLVGDFPPEGAAGAPQARTRPYVVR